MVIRSTIITTAYISGPQTEGTEIMNASVAETEYRGSGLWNTEPYHIEKYVVPGAVAVTLLYIFPWYMLGGSALGGVDLGTALIATLVVGHLIESLKVYQWGPMVKKNFSRFNGNIEGLLLAGGIEKGFLTGICAWFWVLGGCPGSGTTPRSEWGRSGIRSTGG